MEQHFTCPYCWSRISMVLDTSQSQSYIEDCERCCNPIEVSFEIDEENNVTQFDCSKAQ